MKKGVYRQTDVNKINWTEIKEKVKNQRVTFSVDVAKQSFVGVLTTEDGETICTPKWEHPQGTLRLVENLCNSLSLAGLEVVMEPSGTYGDVLRWQFIKRGIPVYRVSPKQVHDRAESYDGVPSLHDAKAAHIIAELHHEKHSALWKALTEVQRSLQGLSSELEIHQKIHRANLNRLSALMSRHWPELEYEVSLSSISVLTLLSEYGEPCEVTAHAEKAMLLLKKTGGYFLKAEKCQAILEAAHNSLGIPCTVGEHEYIIALANDLLRTHQATLDVEKRMAQASGEDGSKENIVNLCGVTTCTVLSAILGDLDQYANPASLLKAVGLNLRERSSGKHKGQLSITKRGSSKVRFYLYWLVLRLVQKDPVIKTWYKRKVIRDGGRFKGRAIIAVMRKVVKGLWHVGQGKEFDSHKLFNLA